MEEQLGRSLPDGRRAASRGQVDITVRTLDDTAGLLIGAASGLVRWNGSLVPRGWLAARDAEVKLGQAEKRIEQLTAAQLPI